MAIKRKHIVCAVLIVSSSMLLLWYMYKEPSSTPSILCFPSKCHILPGEIKSWMGNGLVTTVQPPVQANCQLLKDGNHTEQERVTNELKNWTNSETDSEFYTKVQKCSYVRNLLSSNNFYISDTERNFPLAYAMLFYGSPQQIMRLLRVIYRPHNVYCLHPDGKADKKMIQAFRKLASCFDNIFIPNELVSVTYMHISMVDAQLKCLHHLVNDYQHFQWKYASILCGKELPFNSNRVMVEKLKEMNGDSVVNVENMPAINYRERFTSYFSVKNGRMKENGSRNETMPFGMQMYKSLNYISASRQFAIFLLTNPKVKALHRYMSTALIPDEEFYATAYMLPEAPTAHRIGLKLSLVKTFFTAARSSKECSGKKVHFSCILNVRDIHSLYMRETSTVIFYNKYLMEYDHVVMDCIEKRIVEQNKLEYDRDCI